VASGDGRIVVENVNVPGYAVRVDAAMYNAMRAAMLRVLPRHDPGLTQSEIRRAVVPHLPSDLFPNGAKAGWWAKIVQLDLEAKSAVVRESSKPLRWHRLQ
jgi:hypothetical protein